MTVITGTREARLPSIAGNTVQLRDVTSGEKKTTVRLQTQRRLPLHIHPMETPSRLQESRIIRYICGTLRQESPKARLKG